jgi:hypothetical protein
MVTGVRKSSKLIDANWVLFKLLVCPMLHLASNWMEEGKLVKDAKGKHAVSVLDCH